MFVSVASAQTVNGSPSDSANMYQNGTYQTGATVNPNTNVNTTSTNGVMNANGVMNSNSTGVINSAGTYNPGLPNTGGGDMTLNWLLLLTSGAMVAGGMSYLIRSQLGLR